MGRITLDFFSKLVRLLYYTVLNYGMEWAMPIGHNDDDGNGDDHGNEDNVHRGETFDHVS